MPPQAKKVNWNLTHPRYKHDDPEINLDDFLVKDLAQLRKCHRLLAEKMSEKAGTNYSKSILQAQDVNSKPADELSLTGEKFQAYLHQAFFIDFAASNTTEYPKL